MLKISVSFFFSDSESQDERFVSQLIGTPMKVHQMHDLMSAFVHKVHAGYQNQLEQKTTPFSRVDNSLSQLKALIGASEIVLTTLRRFLVVRDYFVDHTRGQAGDFDKQNPQYGPSLSQIADAMLANVQHSQYVTNIRVRICTDLFRRKLYRKHLVMIDVMNGDAHEGGDHDNDDEDACEDHKDNDFNDNNTADSNDNDDKDNDNNDDDQPN